jgi:hypothetical protein
MSVSQVQAKDRLDEASNWSPWKTRITFALEDLELWDIVQALIVVPHVTAPALVAKFRKKKNKEKRTICDEVRDQVIPHLIGKDYAFEISDSLCKLYQSSNQNRKMVLQDRLKSIKMLDSKSVSSFLGRFTKIRDELAAVGEIVDPRFMVRTALNIFSKPWGAFA